MSSFSTHTHAAAPFSGPIDCLRKTYSKEGVRGLYQGLPSPLVGAMAENSILFLAFSQISQQLKSKGSDTLSLPVTCLTGGLSGACAAFALTPIELIKCRVQVANLQSGLYEYGVEQKMRVKTGVWSTLKSVLRSDGVAGLFRGFTPTLIRETGGGALWFGTYEGVNRLQIGQPESDGSYDKTKLKPWQVMLSGSCAGVIFNSSFFPVDVVKSIEQTSPDQHITKMEIIRNVWAKDGIRGFYRGLGVTVARAIPSSALIFLTYEHLSSKWDTLFK